MLSRYLVLSPFPPGFRDPAFPLRPRLILSGRLEPASRSLPPPPLPLAGAPAVYFTLGTVFNVESGDLFERVLAGLAGLAINVIATVGREIDPAEFGPQPAHIQIAATFPRRPSCPTALRSSRHGGSGSVTAALAHGLPLVLIPMGADQTLQRRPLCRPGVGRVLDAVEATPADVAAAVTAVLADPAYHQSAQRLQAEIAALPRRRRRAPVGTAGGAWSVRRENLTN